LGLGKSAILSYGTSRFSCWAIRKVLPLLLEIPRGRIKSQNWKSYRDGGEDFKHENLLGEKYRYFLEQHIPEKKTYYPTLIFV